jgi:Zn-dependent protease
MESRSAISSSDPGMAMLLWLGYINLSLAGFNLGPLTARPTFTD